MPFRVDGARADHFCLVFIVAGIYIPRVQPVGFRCAPSAALDTGRSGMGDGGQRKHVPLICNLYLYAVVVFFLHIFFFFVPTGNHCSVTPPLTPSYVGHDPPL